MSNVPSTGPEFKVVCADVSLLSSVPTSVSSSLSALAASRDVSVDGAGRVKQEELTASSRRRREKEKSTRNAVGALDCTAAHRIPLLLAAVLLHCEKVVTFYNEELVPGQKERSRRKSAGTSRGAALPAKSPSGYGASEEGEQSQTGEAARYVTNER